MGVPCLSARRPDRYLRCDSQLQLLTSSKSWHRIPGNCQISASLRWIPESSRQTRTGPVPRSRIHWSWKTCRHREWCKLRRLYRRYGTLIRPGCYSNRIHLCPAQSTPVDDEIAPGAITSWNSGTSCRWEHHFRSREHTSGCPIVHGQSAQDQCLATWKTNLPYCWRHATCK